MTFATDLGSFSTLRLLKRITYILILFQLLSSCAGFQFLKEGEKLLYKQNIRSGKVFDKYTLEDLFVQKANVKTPPYAVMYQWGLSRFDTAYYLAKRREIDSTYTLKIENTASERKRNKLELKKKNKIEKINNKLLNGNNLMKWGEPLAIFDSSMVEKNKQNLENYMFNEGYFFGKAETRIRYRGLGKRKGKKVIVDYIIKPGKPYLIDTIYYRSSDSTILSLMRKGRKKSRLKEGENYDQDELLKERERLEYYLKDNGYYDFSRQFIRYEIDTTYGKGISRKVAVRITVNQPSKDKHKQFIVDSVNFIINPGSNQEVSTERTLKERNRVNYSVYEDIFSTKMLARRVFISPDSLYSRSNSIRTQRQLSNLDNFRFININYDSTGGNFVANIYTSPLERYQWSHEVGINVTQGFPGPFYNLAFKKRNIFRGLENFEINGRYGIEGVATPGDASGLYRNKEIGVNAGLTFPQFLLPVSQSFKDKIGKVNPKTRVIMGYTDTDRYDYRRSNINLSNTYTWENENKTYFSFALTDVSIINTSNLSDNFRLKLEQLNSRLINSFEPSFVSDMKFSFYRTDIDDEKIPSIRTSYYRVQMESGGTVLNLVNPGPLENRDLEYFKYLKGDFDYSRSKPISAVASIAYRFNVGVAYPYSSNRALPYEKYFFAGGSNGIRAWRPRRLGPGSFTPLDNVGNVNYDLEQQGEVLLQASVEFRRDLFGFIESAVFIDAGNIWMINDDINREGENFQFNQFYKEIAVGTGFGLRFDFSFLIMRFDVGIKTLDPARDPGKRFLFSDHFFDFPFDNNKNAELVVFNIGVGYPF